MNNGGWVGSPPYAYRLDGLKKNRRLVLDDPDKARTVQRIFREFVEERRSMRNIAERLNDEEVAAPSGRVKGWRWDTVRVLLENPAYTGDYKGGRYAYGKYHHIMGGKVEKTKGVGRTMKPEAEWIVRRDHHDAIIDRETFDRAQALFAEGKTGRSPYTPEENPYLLAGLLRCSKCGCAMWGVPSKGRRYYECGHRQYSKANGGEAKAKCEGSTVREDTLMNSIADHLDTWLGFDGDWIDLAAHVGTVIEKLLMLPLLHYVGNDSPVNLAPVRYPVHHSGEVDAGLAQREDVEAIFNGIEPTEAGTIPTDDGLEVSPILGVSHHPLEGVPIAGVVP